MDPLGYDITKQSMIKPTQLPPQEQARIVYQSTQAYFTDLENAVKTAFKPLVGSETVDLGALKTATEESERAQRELSRKLFETLKQFSIPTARIGGRLFNAGEDSFYCALVNAYTDLAALERKRVDTKALATYCKREPALRALTDYREQYNDREPQKPLAQGTDSQSYAEHFKDDELSHLVLNLLDEEQRIQRTPTLPSEESHVWEHLVKAIADGYQRIFTKEYHKAQRAFGLLRQRADTEVGERTTRMFKIQKIEEI